MMHQHPGDSFLADAELLAVEEYRVKHQAYVEFLRHKAKMAWSLDGDENTKLLPKASGLEGSIIMCMLYMIKMGCGKILLMRFLRPF